MTEAGRLWIAATALAFSLQGGCIGIHSYRMSEPAAASRTARLKDQTLWLETAELRLGVKAVNQQLYRDTVILAYLPMWENVEAPKGASLRILIELEPLVAGLALVPSAITYVAPNGSEIRPYFLEAPGVAEELAAPPLGGCGGASANRAGARGPKAAVKRVLDEPMWIRIHFPVSEDPRAPFTLRIDGICNGDSSVALPEIHFKPTTKRRLYMATVN
jgi:hypothetical protein